MWFFFCHDTIPTGCHSTIPPCREGSLLSIITCNFSFSESQTGCEENFLGSLPGLFPQGEKFLSLRQSHWEASCKLLPGSSSGGTGRTSQVTFPALWRTVSPSHLISLALKALLAFDLFYTQACRFQEEASHIKEAQESLPGALVLHFPGSQTGFLSLNYTLGGFLERKLACSQF